MRKPKVRTIVFMLIAGVIVFFMYFQIKSIESSTNKSSETSLIQDKLLELSEWTTL